MSGRASSLFHNCITLKVVVGPLNKFVEQHHKRRYINTIYAVGVQKTVQFYNEVVRGVLIIFSISQHATGHT